AGSGPRVGSKDLRSTRTRLGSCRSFARHWATSAPLGVAVSRAPASVPLAPPDRPSCLHGHPSRTSALRRRPDLQCNADGRLADSVAGQRGVEVQVQAHGGFDLAHTLHRKTGTDGFGGQIGLVELLKMLAEEHRGALDAP